MTVDLRTRLACLLRGRYLQQWPDLVALVLDTASIPYRTAAFLEEGYLELLPWYNISGVERTPLQTGEAPWDFAQPLFREEQHFLTSATNGGPFLYLGFDTAPSPFVRDLFEAISGGLSRPEKHEMSPRRLGPPMSEELEESPDWDPDPPLAGSRPAARSFHPLPEGILDEVRLALEDWEDFHQLLACLHNWKWASAALLKDGKPLIVHGYRPEEVGQAADWQIRLEDGYSLFLGIRKKSRGEVLGRYMPLLMAMAHRAEPAEPRALPWQPQRCLETIRNLHPEVSWLGLFHKGRLRFEEGTKDEGQDLRVSGSPETELVLRVPDWRPLLPTLLAVQPMIEAQATGQWQDKPPIRIQPRSEGCAAGQWQGRPSKTKPTSFSPEPSLDWSSQSLRASIRRGVLLRGGSEQVMAARESQVLWGLLDDLDVRKKWENRPGPSSWSLEFDVGGRGFRIRGGEPPAGSTLLERFLRRPDEDPETIAQAARAFRDGDVSGLSALLGGPFAEEVAPLLAALGARAVQAWRLWITDSQASLVIRCFAIDHEMSRCWLECGPALTELPYESREALVELYARSGLWTLVEPALQAPGSRVEMIRLLSDYPRESGAGDILLRILSQVPTEPDPAWLAAAKALCRFPTPTRSRALEALREMPESATVVQARFLLDNVYRHPEDVLRWLAVSGDEAEIADLSEEVGNVEELGDPSTFEVRDGILLWNARRLHELTLSAMEGDTWDRYWRFYPGELSCDSGRQVNNNFVRLAMYQNDPQELQRFLRVGGDCYAAGALHDAAWLLGEADDPEWLQSRHRDIRDVVYRLLVLRGWEEGRFLSDWQWERLGDHPDWSRFELERALMRGDLDLAKGLLTDDYRAAGYGDVIAYLGGDLRPRAREWTHPFPILFFRLACFQNRSFDLLRQRSGGVSSARVCPWVPYEKLEKGGWYRYSSGSIGYMSLTRTWLHGGLKFACELGQGSLPMEGEIDAQLGQQPGDAGMNLAARRMAREALQLPAPEGVEEAARKASEYGYCALSRLLCPTPASAC